MGVALVQTWGMFKDGSFSLSVFGFGITMFVLVMGTAVVEEKIPALKKSKIFGWVTEGLLTLMLLSVPVFVVSAIIEWANQPSGFEICMEKTKNMTDQDAIDYIADYCYENSHE